MSLGTGITIMPKALRDAPETQILTGCPCCEEAIILHVRIFGNELCVGISSPRTKAIREALMSAIDGSIL